MQPLAAKAARRERLAHGQPHAIKDSEPKVTRVTGMRIATMWLYTPSYLCVICRICMDSK
jgi:hypothetical protein